LKIDQHFGKVMGKGVLFLDSRGYRETNWSDYKSWNVTVFDNSKAVPCWGRFRRQTTLVETFIFYRWVIMPNLMVYVKRRKHYIAFPQNYYLLGLRLLPFPIYTWGGKGILAR